MLFLVSCIFTTFRKQECENELSTVSEQLEYYQSEKEKYADAEKTGRN